MIINYHALKIVEGGFEILLACKGCARDTYHEIVVSAKISGDIPENDESFWEEYRIVRCRGCKELSFLKEWRWTGDLDRKGDLLNHLEIYPSRAAGRQQIKNLFSLPNQVRSIYQETYSALSNQQPILVGIGIRAIVETVCKQKEAHGSDLKERIDKLVDLGELTKSQAEFLHELRFLGNEAAHEVEAHQEQTLSTAMDIVENLLQNVYIIPEAAERLKERTKKSK